MRKVVKAKVTSVKQALIGVSKEEHLKEYQKRMEEFCRGLVQPLNGEEVGLQLEQISLKSVAVVNSILPPKSKKNLSQGWSPVLIAHKAQLMFLTMVYKGLKTMPLEFKLRHHIRRQVDI